FLPAPLPTTYHSLSLHDALPIYIPLLQDREDSFHAESRPRQLPKDARRLFLILRFLQPFLAQKVARLLLITDAVVRRFHRLLDRSEEHTFELQSRSDIVCRLLLE